MGFVDSFCTGLKDDPRITRKLRIQLLSRSRKSEAMTTYYISVRTSASSLRVCYARYVPRCITQTSFLATRGQETFRVELDFQGAVNDPDALRKESFPE